MSLKATIQQPDRTLLEAVTSSAGPLAAGALPSLCTATAEGEKNALESTFGATAKPKPAKRARKEAPAEEIAPATLKEFPGSNIPRDFFATAALKVFSWSWPEVV